MRSVITLVFAIGVVACGGGGGSPSPQYFNLGGSVGGLASGATLSVELSVGGQEQQNLAVTSSSFSFAPVSLANVASGTTYTVTVTSQPAGQTCSIADASGTVPSGSNTSIDVNCANNPKLSAFAGNLGGQGSLDGTGAAALFDNPSAIAADGAGNLYVADSFNDVIRKVSPSGITITLAGLAGNLGAQDGTAAAASFNDPTGITVDRSGNIYVADSLNHLIRKVSTAGVVTTLAGSAANGCKSATDGTGSAATFCYPESLTTDSAGNIFVADTDNHTIRKVTPSGDVSTLAGSATLIGLRDGTGSSAAFGNPVGITADGMDNLYVSDGDTIRKITPGAVVTTIAGLHVQVGSADGTGSNARFFLPQGLAAASDGTVYVADTSANAIRVMTPATVVTTLAGTLNSSGGSADGSGGAASFRSPYGITLGPDGNLYIADTGNNTIRKVTLAGAVTTFAGTAPLVGKADGTGTAATFYQPFAAAADANGNVYVTDSRNLAVRKVTPNGVVTTMSLTNSSGTAVNFERPTGIVVDSSGNLYVADEILCTIYEFSAAGVAIKVFGGQYQFGCGFIDGSPGLFGSPAGLAADSAGNVYVADAGNNAIRKISAQGNVSTLASGSAAGFARPMGVAVGSGGLVYVADFYNHAIRVVSSSGAVSTLAGKIGVLGMADGAGTAATFNYPRSVAVDASGNVYVADSGNATIRKVTPSGAVSTVVGTAPEAGFVAGALPGRIPNPSAVALSGSSLYIVAVNGVAVVTNVP